MDAKNLMIKHGEKLLVGLTVVVGGLMTYWSVGDRTSMPLDDAKQPVPANEVRRIVSDIESAMNVDVKPKLVEPLDYAGLLDDRLSSRIPERPVVQFLNRHPSYGIKGSEYQARPYVYEVAAPTVEVAATMQRLTLQVILPKMESGEREFVSDAADRNWSREVEEGKSLRNHAGWQRLEVQWREKGEEKWRAPPLPRVPGGVVPLRVGRSGNGKEFEFDVPKKNAADETQLKEWHTYEFRARLIVSATGWPRREGVEEEGVLEHEVLVFERGKAVAVPEAPDRLAQFVVDMLQKHQGELPGMLPEVEPPAADAEEVYYAGPWSEVGAVTMPSSIRFVLKSVSPMQPPTATFLMVKQDESGNWSEPMTYRVPIDGTTTLGKEEMLPVTIDGVRLEVPFDMRTPFVVKRFDERVERVTHYEVRRVADLGKGDLPPYKLDVIPKTKLTERVVLHNSKTKQDMAMLSVEIFYVQNDAGKKEGALLRMVYPNYPRGRRNEEEIFLADPLNFEQPTLAPPSPAFRPPKPEQEDAAWRMTPADQQWLDQEAARAGTRVLDMPTRPIVLCPDGRVFYLNGNKVNIQRLGIRSFVREGMGTEGGAEQPSAAEDGGR